MKVNIAVFAHNEQENVQRCLESIIEATSHPSSLCVKVLVNGSTDNTLAIVEQFCNDREGFECVDIPLGDKSNAWNEYVYSGIDFTENHYFLDGDNWLPAGALDYVTSKFDSRCYDGLACTPIGISESLRTFMIDNKFISGNFYGLSGGFLKAVLDKNFKIPIGFIGDDSLVQYLLEEGLGADAKFKDILVVPCTGAVVPRPKINLNVFSFMHGRYKRYALRHFQQEAFYYLARNGQLENLPSTARGIKPTIRKIGFKLIFRWCGVQTLYHPWAFFKLFSSGE